MFNVDLLKINHVRCVVKEANWDVNKRGEQTFSKSDSKISFERLLTTTLYAYGVAELLVGY